MPSSLSLCLAAQPTVHLYDLLTSNFSIRRCDEETLTPRTEPQLVLGQLFWLSVCMVVSSFSQKCQRSRRSFSLLYHHSELSSAGPLL